MPRHRKPGSRNKKPTESSPPTLHGIDDLEMLRQNEDWEGFLDVVLDSGDPEHWPEIERHYWAHRDAVLSAIPYHWREHPDLVAPLLKSLLREIYECEKALDAASAFPVLIDDVVECLQDPELLRAAGPDCFVATLACQLGLMEAPPDPLRRFAWGGVDPVLDGVKTELKRRYNLDLDALITRY